MFPSHIKKSITSGIVFCLTVGVISIGYATLTSTLSTSDKSSAGNVVSATSWNRIVDSILELDSRTSALSSSSGDVTISGSVYAGKTAEAWSASNTAGIATSTWTTIPGLDKTITLSRSALVQIQSSGTQRNNTSGNSVCHTGYRYEIDWVWLWEWTHGQRIFVSSLADGWWTMWSFTHAVNLSAWTHTIRVQAHESSSYVPCYICSESPWVAYGYSSCNLNIAAFYN